MLPRSGPNATQWILRGRAELICSWCSTHEGYASFPKIVDLGLAGTWGLASFVLTVTARLTAEARHVPPADVALLAGGEHAVDTLRPT